MFVANLFCHLNIAIVQMYIILQIRSTYVVKEFYISHNIFLQSVPNIAPDTSGNMALPCIFAVKIAVTPFAQQPRIRNYNRLRELEPLLQHFRL